MRRTGKSPWKWLIPLVLVVVMVVTACAPAAAPTPTPTKAAPAATPAAAPKAEATKPAEKPAAAPTTAAPAKATGAPIKVGFITPLSGAMVYLGAMSKVSVELAAEDTNAAGGINGSPVALVIEDSPFDPKQAVTAVRKLADEQKVFAIVGPYSSAEFEVAAPLAVSLQLPVVGPTNMIPETPAANRPWSFGLNVPHEVSAPQYMDDFKKAYPKVKKIVLLGDTKERVTEHAYKNILPKVIPEKGFELIASIPFDRGTTDFSAIVTKIKDLNPEGIVLSALLPEALGLAKELKRQGVNAPLVTNTNPLSGSIIELGAEAVEGWVQPTLFDWENPDPKVQAFFKRAMERGEADPQVKPKPRIIVTEALYYDAAMMVFEMIRRAGVKADTPLQEARKKIADGMNGMKEWQGISGKWSMQPTGQAFRVASPSMILDKGKYKYIR